MASLGPAIRPFVFAAANVNGKIMTVVASGAGYTDSVTSVESYDPQTDTWEQLLKFAWDWPGTIQLW